ncbi:hypothetical protein IVB30_20285 [Bradyrhizobium sp. 200]|uniref:hypothetical protein n=1 Tax=Bradyrhizobium sp. 200 TaxID=2782665 RepID=UPI001FFE5695|nr:hypothetical protein [Bradyrhizobium sp. 200]UPJ53447.1 hypothetical protein IVB30_20285 [Bradyrhizobium sp. 200]
MLFRALGLVLALIVSGGAAAAETKRVGFVAQLAPGDAAARAQSQALLLELKNVGIDWVYAEAFSSGEILNTTRKMIEQDRVDALIIRPSFSSLAGVFSGVSLNVPVVSFNMPIELPQAVYVGYNPTEIGKAQVSYLESQGAKQLLLLDGRYRSSLKELTSAGQWQALQKSPNMKAAADCGGCPKTGDCPKGKSAKECPCPKTGDCPKSAVIEFIKSANVDGVAVLEPTFLPLVADADLAANVSWAGPMPTIDALTEVSKGKKAFAIDPQPVVQKVADVTSKLLAKSSPKDLSGVSKISLDKGETYSVFLPVGVVSDPNTAKARLDALQAK